MDEDNEYNHAPSSSAAIVSMFAQRECKDRLRPVAIALQTWLFGKRLSRGLTRDCLLICAGRGVRGGGEHARVRHPGSVACIQVAAPKSSGERKASVVKSAEANAAGPADVGMN